MRFSRGGEERVVVADDVEGLADGEARVRLVVAHQLRGDAAEVRLAVAEMGVVLGAVDGEEEAIEVVAVAVGERAVEGPPAEVAAVLVRASMNDVGEGVRVGGVGAGELPDELVAAVFALLAKDDARGAA